MPIELTYSKGNQKQNTKFQIIKDDFYTTTKGQNINKGKWYFECTHYDGGSNLHLFGFKLDDNLIQFYPESRVNEVNIYTFIAASRQDRTLLPFLIDGQNTIGIGIDLERRRFYVFYNNNYFSIEYINVKFRRLDVVVRGSVYESTNDYISINLGDSPFTYNITGFTPFNEIYRKFTCPIKHNTINSLCFIINMILS